jgi:hypothetical protein
MSKNIQGVKIGNTVSLSIDGKLHKKLCTDPKEADELFKAVIKAKEDPSDANVKALRILINERTRKIIEAGLEADTETGEAYLAGFNTPIPDTLLTVIKDYHENGYPLDAVINFWKLLMINPDTRVRTSLFDFITAHDFVLTDKGYMVVYKAVYYKGEEEGTSIDKPADATLTEFISNSYLHIKSKWKCSPNKYVAYRNLGDDSFAFTKLETAEGWDEEDKNIEVLGKVGDLYAALVLADNKQADVEAVVKPIEYTDMHTRTFSIRLGEPVKQARKTCDADPSRDCSNGLHVGATSYVNRFANKECAILACLVNPANVVAVPNYDHSKMRVDEYFPFAVATYTDGKIDIVEQKYFEEDYCTYEVAELEAQIALVQAGELPIGNAKNGKAEMRPMKELLKMLELRVFDINK